MITPQIRDLIWQRAQDRCEGCGRMLFKGYSWCSIQHRVARGMGGGSEAWIDLPANLLLLCGTATSPGCHRTAEDRGNIAEAAGWWVRHRRDPHTIPVLLYGGRWVLLADNGHYIDDVKDGAV